MSSNSARIDFQKPVKVKSWWTQSCQMEMIEEPQSSLDNISDAITDVSTSKTNESSDYSFEQNCVELRRSRRSGSNRTDYRQLNGFKKNRQKPSTTSLKTSNTKGRKRKEPLNIPKVDKDCGFENNIPQEPNIIENPLIDWNNITICMSSRRSKSVNNINEIDANLPLISFRRQASLMWNFKFTLTNDIEDNNSILERENFRNVLNGIIYLNINETGLQTSSSTDNKQLCKDNESTNKESTKNENIFQQPYSDIDTLNSHAFEQKNNEVLNIEFNEMSATTLNKQKQSDELNIHINRCDKENSYQINCLEILESYSSELENLILGPINKFREIRSKSSESLMIRTNNSIKRIKSCDDINKLDNSVVDVFKLQKSKKNTTPRKRRQSKRIKYKTNSIEIPDDIQVPEVNYNQVADEMYREHQSQLIEARIKDKEFDKKLESTNFTLVTENIYRPTR